MTEQSPRSKTCIVCKRDFSNKSLLTTEDWGEREILQLQVQKSHNEKKIALRQILKKKLLM